MTLSVYAVARTISLAPKARPCKNPGFQGCRIEPVLLIFTVNFLT
jgi:hypothetical protein